MPPELSPRIYCINPQLVDAGGWPRMLDHCVALGFDHVFIVRDAHGLAAMDFGSADLPALLQECTLRDIRVLVDLSVSRIDAGDPMLQQHPEWFDAPQRVEGGLPDPRVHDPELYSARLRWEDPATMEAALDAWTRHLDGLIDLGVAGFVCRAPGLTPPEVWRRLSDPLRARRACCHLMAWTPGTPAGQMAGLAQCGFDAVFGSGAWWDFRADWWAQEQDSLRAIAPAVAFPEDPFGARLARQWHLQDADSIRRGTQRALHFAAATGSGWLMNMGFEYGLQEPLFGKQLGAFSDAESYRQACAQSAFDFTHDVTQANRFVAETGSQYRGARIRMLSAPHAPLAQIERAVPTDPTLDPLLVSVNSDLHYAQRQTVTGHQHYIAAPLHSEETEAAAATGASDGNAADGDTVAPGAVTIRRLQPQPSVKTVSGRSKRSVLAANRAPRVAIEAVTPAVDGGRFPVKRVAGDTLAIEADILLDGHDHLAAQVLWRAADAREWESVPMREIGNDRWQAQLPLQRVGRILFAIEAWRDAFDTYRDELEKKSRAGLDLTLELEEGRLMVARAAHEATDEDARTLKDMARALTAVKARDRDKLAVHDAGRTELLLSPQCAELVERHLPREFVVRTEIDYPVDVERTAARFSSWYELFPRSQSGDEHRHGTFDDVIARLPAVAAMGFDTLYFPPIHPIGRRNRKGRNNSLTPDASDPGSPYAIGSEDGGHDAIHPELGTLEDFRALRAAAAEHGLELALDFAIQCSPDHPWLASHPDWFAWRPDGSIRYAENPPKKYEDIVNVDFYAANALPELWIALRDVVLFWANEGVRAFRVDNPHTKPLPFWEWLIADIRGRYPDALFLSESFTRPKMMYRLGKVGFSQSYTYFTWRNGKDELAEYLTELNQPPVSDFFRPHFFVNTPDINPYFLQRSGRPGFLIRAALAATLSGLWGVYSGFELCEAQPVPGKEEYLDSEKYQIRAWDWQKPGNIVGEITQLNRVRRANPALHTHTGVHFQPIGNGNLLAFVKATERRDGKPGFGDNVILTVINLDPFSTQSGELELPLWQFGLPDHGVLAVEDLVHGHRFDWHGKFQTVTLDPHETPYAIWRLRLQGQ